jgi:uncharacterized protein YprB with RNaseH-like and TPR domain
MIKNTFVLLDGIGYKTEEKLWNQNILCWDDFLSEKGIGGISSRQKKHHDKELEAALTHLTCNNPKYFSQRLKSRDHWRLYPEFRGKTCFLDIETTGLSSYSDITLVGIFNGDRVKSFVRDINLTEETLRRELSKYSMIITFYGSAFDLPFIIKKFPSISFDIPHVDLCFASRRIGFRGGLKAIEKQLGIARNNGISEVDGFEAVRLWRKWKTNGDKDALERLIEYNKADVVNLRVLADLVYQRLRDNTFQIPSAPFGN